MRFFKYILITFIGLFTLIGLTVVVVLGLLLSEIDEIELPGMAEDFDEPDRILLSVSLGEGVPEAPGGPFQRQLSLTGMIRALEQAADDPKVVGLMADLSNARPGLAQAEEIRTAIERFRQAGKKTIAYAESFGTFGDGTAGYYVASAFEEIHLQPSGDLAMTGVSMTAPFFAGALERLGIEADFERRHEYKGAMEQFTRPAHSLPVSENFDKVIDRAFEVVVRGIAGSRSLPATDISTLMDQAPLSAREALGAGLVDALTYPSALRKERPVSLDAGLLPLRAYNPPKETAEQFETAPHIAVVPVIGPILPGRGGPQGLDRSENVYAQDLADALMDAAENDDVDAVLLRLDSPGGSYTGSDAVWHAIQQVKAAGKPVIAWMGNVAGSGGYFIAMGADVIIAQPSTITGSIGVFTGKFVIDEALDQLGIGIEVYARGENVALDSPVERFSASERRKLNVMLDRIYTDFTDKAAAARGLSEAEVDTVARGRIFAGTDAAANGLIDLTGGYPEALAALRSALNVDAATPLDLFPYPPPPDPIETVIEALTSGEFLAAAGALNRLAGILTTADGLLRAPGVLESHPVVMR